MKPYRIRWMHSKLRNSLEGVASIYPIKIIVQWTIDSVSPLCFYAVNSWHISWLVSSMPSIWFSDDEPHSEKSLFEYQFPSIQSHGSWPKLASNHSRSHCTKLFHATIKSITIFKINWRQNDDDDIQSTETGQQDSPNCQLEQSNGL